jgi:hypothetical protein
VASNRWGGWIAFAGWMMMIIGSVDAFEGLIAVIRKQYYVATPSQIIVFDVKTWGWVTLIWGVILVFAGIAVLVGSEWGRWFAIIAGSLTFIEQLGFVGSYQYPLWALTVIGLTAVALYALIVRWHDAKEAGDLA